MPIVLEEVIDLTNWMPFGIKRKNKHQRQPPYRHRMFRIMLMTIVIVTIMAVTTKLGLFRSQTVRQEFLNGIVRGTSRLRPMSGWKTRSASSANDVIAARLDACTTASSATSTFARMEVKTKTKISAFACTITFVLPFSRVIGQAKNLSTSM
jgi:hypothetical protein